MKDAHLTEILALVIAGIGGILIWNLQPSWLGFLAGVIVFILDSYIIGNLKRQTIEEYIKLKSQKQDKKQ
jgi:hypothetical protein